jgi:phage tail-like protein
MVDEKPRLEVSLEGNVVQTVALETPVLSIGRLPDNGLPLPHPMVSRHHADLRLDAGRVVLTDTGSANGTFVNGVRLLANQPRELAGGDIVQIGPFELAYTPTTAMKAMESPGEEAPTPFAPAPGTAGSSRASTPTSADLDSSPRPSLAVPLPDQPASAYLDDLPVIYQGSDFLGRFLLIFEAIWEPLEQRQDHIAMFFDPRTCPAGFLPWLGSWLDVACPVYWPESRLRRLLSEAMELYRWRGTRYGMTRLLELCTGLPVEVTESPDIPFQFQVRVRVPPGDEHSLAFMERLIQVHKPAHAGYSLERSA